MNAGEHSGRQAGAVLVVGLILLTLVTLVGFGSIRSSVMELRMANRLATLTGIRATSTRWICPILSMTVPAGRRPCR